MKTVADVIKAVKEKLEEQFPDVRVWSTDKSEDFGKKCFFIKYTASRDGKPDFIHDYGEIRLYYFPESDKVNRIELLDMQEQLSQLFLFRVFAGSEFAIPIPELTFEIDNDVLVMSFDFDLYQEVDLDSSLPDMEVLEVE